MVSLHVRLKPVSERLDREEKNVRSSAKVMKHLEKDTEIKA